MVQTDTAYSSSSTQDAYGRNVSGLDHENAGIATTASYADLLLIDNRKNRELLISLVETGAAQSLLYKVLASIDDATSQPASTDASYHTLITDVSITASGKDYQILAAPWKWVVVQVKNNSGAATVTGRARGV